MKRIILLILAVFFILSGAVAEARDIYQIISEDSTINGAIRYHVVGKYNARFEEFDGEIIFDPQQNMISGVVLNIKTASIVSEYKSLDKVVRSKKLLSAEEYPQIIFEGQLIEKSEEGYMVKGTLDLHGVQKELSLPFEAHVLSTNEAGDDILKVRGKWMIKRKEFDIIWHPFLDFGGILVGNTMIIDWQVEAKKE